MAGTEDKAVKLWENNFVEEDKVDWLDFIKKFGEHFGENLNGNLDSSKMKAFKAILTFPSKDEGNGFPGKDKGGDDCVTLDNYAKVVKYFGPIENSGMNLINRVDDILQRLWFHGELDTDMTEAKLKGKPAGTFLVRFSSAAGCFTISTKEESRRVKQFRITRSGADFIFNGKSYRTLEELMVANGRSMSLKQPCPDSPFTKIYTPNANAYQADIGYGSTDFF
eukprot:TRINITY_DN6206_c0_g1_i1.p1 TRINITY_DN6206_c0_g1~~TRINITY_DN6206_c0_g1_i1.p1  ORF type:complete len:223 (+),score=59.27 TRINITY_DN6206_c0_g1_i1:163-831(+)